MDLTVPTITHVKAEVVDEPVSISAAARLTGMSRHSVEKIVGGGYIRLVRSDITALAREPFISAGGALPVVQTDVAETDGTWRPYTGDASWLTDADWLLAQAGDWTGVSSRAIVDAGYLAVGLGGMVTGIVRVEGRAPGAPAGRIRWRISLVGRLTSSLRAGGLSFGDDVSTQERELVLQTLGMRYPVRRGGAFTWV